MPDDIKGMKIRPADATIANFVTLLGGTNVQSSAPEVRDIIERGVADAVTFPWGSLVLFGIDKVTKYHMDAPLYVTTFAFVMNKDKYNQMSDRQKKAIDDNCNTEAAGRVGEPWGEFEDAGIDKVKAEAGQEVYKLTPEQTAVWKKAAEPLVKTWADGVKKTGVDPDAALADLQGLARQIQRAGAVTSRRIRFRWRRRESPAAAFPAIPEPCGADMKRASMDRFIDTIEWIAAGFVGIVAANIFISVLLRNVFNYSIPDSFDIGRLLLGILIFWGIAATSYRGTHITVDLVWANVGPRYQRMIDVFATLVLLFVVTRADLDLVRQGARHL